MGGTDKEMIMDAYNLKGICLFRLGSLIDAVKALYKARKFEAKIKQEVEDRRRARMKVVVDEVVGFFTQKDYERMNRKRRSNSYLFENHFVLKRPKRNTLKRDLSWSTFDWYNHKTTAEQKEDQKSESSSDEDDTPPEIKRAVMASNAIRELNVEEVTESSAEHQLSKS